MKLLLTSEHGGNILPKEFKQLIPKKVLLTHRAIDIGANDLALFLQKKTKAPLVSNLISRLLIEFNRSLHHRQLFSSYSKTLPPSVKKRLIDELYLPYRRDVKKKIGKKETLHLSIHSFTPKLRGKVRAFDIGILYDPKRELEKAAAHYLKKLLAKRGWSVRLNAPYKGASDGLTTSLRSEFKEKRYLGIELEVNQKLFKMGKSSIKRDIADAILELLDATKTAH